jgi:hypothetical protein
MLSHSGQFPWPPTDEDVQAAVSSARGRCKDPRARVLSVDELLELLEQRAMAAVVEAEKRGIGRVRSSRFVLVPVNMRCCD